MRKEQLLNNDWLFRYHDGTESRVDVPHTWNNIDGQDGGNDYYRGTCVYEKTFDSPEYSEDQRVYIEFCGVNASAKVILNGDEIVTHDGGYSTFRADITDFLKAENHLVVEVDNSVNDRVYPQWADFTFFGGIYRNVNLIVTNKVHFDLDYYGSPSIKVTPEIKDKNADVEIEVYVRNVENPSLKYIIKDAEGTVVAETVSNDKKGNKIEC